MRLLLFILILPLFIACKDESTTKKAAPQKELALKKVREISGFDTPQAIIWDAKSKHFYVSNDANNNPEIKNEGFISKLNTEAEFLEKHWIDSLPQPKGMTLFKNKLYIATDSALVAVDIEKKRVDTTYAIGKAGEQLNDVVKRNNALLISGKTCNCLYKFHNKNIEKVYTGLKKPSGIAVQKDSLFVLNSGTQSLNHVNLQSKRDSVLTRDLGIADGITPFKKGFFISDWEGGIFYVNSKWEPRRLTDTREKRINTTGILYNEKHNRLYVPTLRHDKVLLFKPVYKSSQNEKKKAQ